MRVLVVSNLDSARPFGQFTRPFYLGREIARLGEEVANLGIDCERVDFGPTTEFDDLSVRSRVRAVRRAVREFRPDVLYAHQNAPALAALLGAEGVPVVADFHSVASIELTGSAKLRGGLRSAVTRAAGARARAVETLIARRSAKVIAAGPEVADAVRRRNRPRVPPAVVLNGADPQLARAPRAPDNPFGNGAGSHALATLPVQSSPSNERALGFMRDVTGSLRSIDADVAVNIMGTDRGAPVPGMRFLGFQPELQSWLDHADVCLLPYPEDAALFGGPRNKLIEYLVRARTIVTTPEGLRGFGEAANWKGVYVVEPEPLAFAHAILAAAQPGADTLEQSRDAARRLAWDDLARDVAAILLDATTAGRRGAP
jgi:hypothetical protein